MVNDYLIGILPTFTLTVLYKVNLLVEVISLSKLSIAFFSFYRHSGLHQYCISSFFIFYFLFQNLCMTYFLILSVSDCFWCRYYRKLLLDVLQIRNACLLPILFPLETWLFWRWVKTHSFVHYLYCGVYKIQGKAMTWEGSASRESGGGGLDLRQGSLSRYLSGS